MLIESSTNELFLFQRMTTAIEAERANSKVINLFVRLGKANQMCLYRGNKLYMENSYHISMSLFPNLNSDRYSDSVISFS